MSLTQELLAFESVDISECLGDEFDKSACFQNPTTVNEIEQRERDRLIPKKTRQSTAWSVNVYLAWAEYRNTQIESLGNEYRSIPVDLAITPVEEVNYRLTRFILEVMSGHGKPYPANSLYAISTGLLRHSRVDLNRYDLNILSKDDPHFRSFRNACGSFDCGRRGTVMAIWYCWISLVKNIKVRCILSQLQNVCLYPRVMNEHVNLMAEQYEFGTEKEGD